MRALATILMFGVLAGCAPYEAEPNSPVQWQRRQEAIERQEAERQRLCSQPDKATRPQCNARPGGQP